MALMASIYRTPGTDGWTDIPVHPSYPPVLWHRRRVGQGHVQPYSSAVAEYYQEA